MKQLAFFFLAAITGCAGDDVALLTVHQHAAPELDTEGSVNTYWIETPHSLIVTDGLRTIPDAEAATADLAALGKPISAIFVTHPHPDHIGGLGVFAALSPDAPIYASQTAADEMASDSQGLIALARSFEGANFPEAITQPTRIVADGEQVEIDGLRLDSQVFGPSESIDALVIRDPLSESVFVGDLVANHMAVALMEGRSAAWLEQLGTLRETVDESATLYPGHGRPGPALPLIAAQTHYLERFRALVLEHRLDDGTVDDAGKAQISSAIEAEFPDHPFVAAKFPDMQNESIAAVAKELAAATP